jgi:hypothetical protein
MCAYTDMLEVPDWATAGPPRVKPGDTILVHAGLYNTTVSSTRTIRSSTARCRSTARIA